MKTPFEYVSKIKVFLITCTVLVSPILVWSVYQSLTTPKPNVSQKSLPIIEMHFVYPADFRNDKILVGASHNMFVGKILGQVGIAERGVGPETQFAVQVISNIKGNLQGTVTVDQEGGYANGALYVGEGDVVGGASGKYLLQIGSTYMLATRYDPTSNWYVLNPFPAASKFISSDTFLGLTQLQTLASNDPRILQLQAAYQNEILLPADVAHNNTLNSYLLLHPIPVLTIPSSSPSSSNISSSILFTTSSAPTSSATSTMPITATSSASSSTD